MTGCSEPDGDGAVIFIYVNTCILRIGSVPLRVGLGGVSCALVVIFMVLSWWVPIGDLPLMALSSLMLLMPLKKGMFKTAGLCYVAVSLLTFLLTGYFVAIIPYLVFFVLYPIEISLFDRYRIH